MSFIVFIVCNGPVRRRYMKCSHFLSEKHFDIRNIRGFSYSISRLIRLGQ